MANGHCAIRHALLLLEAGRVKSAFRGRAERRPNPEGAAFGGVPSGTSQKPDCGSTDPATDRSTHGRRWPRKVCQPRRGSVGLHGQSSRPLRPVAPGRAGMARGQFRRLSWRAGTEQTLPARFAFARVVPVRDDGREQRRRERLWLVCEWRDGEEHPVNFYSPPTGVFPMGPWSICSRNVGVRNASTRSSKTSSASTTSMVAATQAGTTTSRSHSLAPGFTVAPCRSEISWLVE